MIRALRQHRTELLWVAVMIALAVAIAAYVTGHQRLQLPAWVPVVGHERFFIDAEFASAAGVMPGQGQMVTVSGVPIGEVDGVRLQNGRAVVRLAIKPRYARIYPDATALLRPKTGLKDMVVELDPGTPKSGPKLEDGATLGIGATNPDVDLDQILASLDADTRDALVLLIGAAGDALGKDNGRALANTLRRFPPLSRHTAKATKLVALRRVRLKRVMHNLSALADELGDNDRQLGRFVNASNAVFTHFSNQNEKLAETLKLLPDALHVSNDALSKLDTLGKTLETGLRRLQPAAQSLGPTLRETRPFLKTTTPVLEKQLRPFAREAQPTAEKLAPAAKHLAKATPNLSELTDVLNALMNTLAHDPPGDGPKGQSYLFYVPWASHNTNSVLSGQDALSPLRRSLVFVSCGSLQLLESQASPTRNPTLSTLIQLLHAPDYRQLIAQGRCPYIGPPPPVITTIPPGAEAASLRLSRRPRR